MTVQAPVDPPLAAEQKISPAATDQAKDIQPKLAAEPSTIVATPKPKPKVTQPAHDAEAISGSKLLEMIDRDDKEREAKRAAALAPHLVSAPPICDFMPEDADKMTALKAGEPASVTGFILNLRLSGSGKSLYFEFSKLTNPAEIMAVAHKREYKDDFTTDTYKDLIGKKVRFDGTVFREPTGKQYVKISARAQMKIVE
jgi:hypothetical protein